MISAMPKLEADKINTEIHQSANNCQAFAIKSRIVLRSSLQFKNFYLV